MVSELDAHTFTSSSNRPHSIDLTLELERELDNESQPSSPVRQDSTNDRPQSLDGNVLASIVTQLRISLENVTRERDDLLLDLDQAAQKQADLSHSLQLVTDRSSQLEEQLSAAQAKNKEDEEAISMLRAKVEESRSVATFFSLSAVSWKLTITQTWANAATNREQKNVKSCD
jgi:chromosome segregation ATPase